MNISEKVAYLKGPAEGLDLGDSKEAKVLAGILDVLEDICEEIYDVEDYCEELSEQLDAVDEDLSVLEDEFYGDDECSCGCGCGPDCDCGCQEGGECTCGDDCGCGCGCDCDCDCDDECYEVECPNCQDVIYLDEEMIEEGKMVCPNCGVELEFDFDDCDCDCDCGCDCEDK